MTVKATANDGSGVSKTKTITISNPEYTCYLKYNANGGSGAPSQQSYTGTSTSNHTFTISSIEPTRSGYTFLGWSTSSSAISATYQPGDTISVGYSSTRTLYAVWEQKVNDFTLSFNANGGSGAPSNQNYTSTSSTYNATIPATVPSRSGYEFQGWSTTNGGTVQYQPGSTIALNTGTTTLYAVWKQTYTATLAYSASGATNVPTNQTYVGTSTSNHTFTISSNIPVKSGFVFKGWATTNGGSVQYQPGSTVSVSYNGTTTLYAIFESAQLDITTTPDSTSVTVGKSFSYTVGASIDGCTVSVSGASWLSVSGNVISGTPTVAGTYDVTVTISKSGGYTSDSQSFTITVYSSMGFTSEPGFDGIYAYVE
ncbi:InlB B-repeat-containing protein [Candidatus Methanoprimaticola sp. MG2]|uniref:InlB B-repeat-containing protein n=1 Tax=Candidatus Methanoprimaticola sp. MG2 TaxID=3228838 RepID=UPI0039C64CB3